MANDHDELSARNDARSEEYLGKRIEDLLADRTALRKRVDALEAALRAIAHHPTGGVGCNPEQFVAAAKAALGGE